MSLTTTVGVVVVRGAAVNTGRATMVEDIGALRLKVLKETWEQRLDKQPDGSWRGPAVRVIQEAELISVDIDSIMHRTMLQ